ncbi:MAG: PH domain-containing protein [Streptosporangiaceae bacterium]
MVGAVKEFAALIAVAATGLAVGGLSAGAMFALVALCVGLVHHVVRWLTFTYELHDDRIEIRRALIGRSVKTIPIERIRGVDITASFTHRLLGVAVVRIDAAADGDEGVLDAVSRREAERLRRLLMRPSEVASEPDSVIARADPSWYRYAPLSGAYLLTPFALLGSALGTLYNLGDEFGLISEGSLSHLGDNVTGVSPLIGIVFFILLVLAMPVASVLVFAWFNWDFTLHARDGSVVAERGLVTRRSVTLERRRIRGVELHDNPLERAAGVVRLNALVTGLGDAEHRGRLLPTSPHQVAWRVAEQLHGSFRADLSPHPRAARGRRIVRAVGPPLAVAVLARFTGPSWLVTAALLAALLGLPLGLDRYRQLGHASDGEKLSVRSGSLRRHQQIIEHRAVVGWRLKQTLFQRRVGLATLMIAVGAGHGGYPATDVDPGAAVAFAASITPAWVKPFLDER